MTNFQRRVAIVGSGTTGHVSPALAIAQAYRQIRPGTQVLFIGTAEGAETRIVPPLGYQLALVPAAPLFGVGLLGKLHALWSACMGIREARRLLRKHEIQLLIGLGGYTSGGVMLAAWSLGVRTAIHEANAIPGKTNWWLRWFVDRVYVGYADAARVFPAQKTRVTGNPVRPEIIEAAAISRRRLLRLAEGRPVRLLAIGGSGGSRFLNEHVPPLLQAVVKRGCMLEIRHQVGAYDGDVVQADYQRLGLSAQVTPYIEDMGDAYVWADFAISGAGALSLAELAVMGLPALIVPVAGTADDHQTHNALASQQAHQEWWVSEAAWNQEHLAQQIVNLLSDVEAWQATSQRIQQAAYINAAQTIVEDCENMISLHSPSG